LQQLKNTWNEINNGSLSYSWQHSDLEMLIPSWGTLYKVVKLQSCKVAKLQSCKIAKLQSCKVAWF
jgi:hypothetical protein